MENMGCYYKSSSIKTRIEMMMMIHKKKKTCATLKQINTYTISQLFKIEQGRQIQSQCSILHTYIIHKR